MGCPQQGQAVEHSGGLCSGTMARTTPTEITRGSEMRAERLAPSPSHKRGFSEGGRRRSAGGSSEPRERLVSPGPARTRRHLPPAHPCHSLAPCPALPLASPAPPARQRPGATPRPVTARLGARRVPLRAAGPGRAPRGPPGPGTGQGGRWPPAPGGQSPGSGAGPPAASAALRHRYLVVEGEECLLGGAPRPGLPRRRHRQHHLTPRAPT